MRNAPLSVGLVRIVVNAPKIRDGALRYATTHPKKSASVNISGKKTLFQSIYL
jgi:hypothetical protein